MDHAESFGSAFTTRAAQYFSLHFENAQISLGLVVVKGQVDLSQKPEHFVLLFLQPEEQVVLGALFGAAWLESDLELVDQLGEPNPDSGRHSIMVGYP